MIRKLATVSLSQSAKMSHLSQIVPPKHCQRKGKLRGPVVSDKHGMAETSSNSNTQWQRVSTSWEDTKGTLYFLFSVFPSLTLTKRERDT